MIRIRPVGGAGALRQVHDTLAGRLEEAALGDAPEGSEKLMTAWDEVLALAEEVNA